MASSHVQPRRRAAQSSKASPVVPQLDSQQCATDPTSTTALRKGSTFHNPTSPISPADDHPVVDFARIPQRAPTSPQALEALAASFDHRVNDIIKSFDNGFKGIGKSSSDDHHPFASPDFFVGRNSLLRHRADIDAVDTQKNGRSKSRASGSSSHDHTSDSGLGESVCESSCSSPEEKAEDIEIIEEEVTAVTSVFTPLDRAVGPSRENHHLSDYAAEKIRKLIVEPLLRQPLLKDFHSLVGDIPVRIDERKITCLRDLEKTLIFLAPVSTDFSAGEGLLAYTFLLHTKRKAKSAAQYLRFCETSIQCIYTTSTHLNEPDQKRPTDRPYNPSYFIDLVAQVRQYARIMAASRQKQAEGKSLGKMDYKPLVLSSTDSYLGSLLTRTHVSGERLVLKGGHAENNKPLELVREKDGEMISIDAGRRALDDTVVADDDASRSMARKRKCDIGKVEYRACRECGKQFTRPCDLTKHEKTHSRPWKCTHKDCKYATLGWPTEKEMERHINDKHSSAPALYKCLFSPCTYTSKRESNCKQHMEKAHGWEYVRSKSKNKGTGLIPSSLDSPMSAPTPASTAGYPHISTPATSALASPAVTLDTINSPASSHESMFSNSLFAPSPAVEQPLEQLDFTKWGFQDPMPLSPESDGRRDSAPMNATGNVSMESSAFTSEFDFGDLNCNNPWPPVDEFFSNQYNLPDNLMFQGQQQLPTPSWSDKDDCQAGVKDMPPLDFGNSNFVAGARDGFMLSQPEPTMGLTPGADSNAGNDFALFGDQTMGGVLSDSQFSNVGGQFPTGASQNFDFSDFHMDHS